jgi:uncharacterized membrane-anchored protein
MMATHREKLLRFHAERHRLLAEAHARPSTPLQVPVSAVRIACVAGTVDAERAHLADLCRSLLLVEPPTDSRWWAVDGGDWALRWERHNEFSSWTIFASTGGDGPPAAWLAALPGDVLVWTLIDVRGDADELSASAYPNGTNTIGTKVLGGAASIFTDFKADQDGLTRMLVRMRSVDQAQTGRLVQLLLEIETYRLMALLAFPVAGEAGQAVARFEEEAGALAARLKEDGNVKSDRALLARIVALSGEAEALNTRTTYRFRAAAAYHELVRERIVMLREERVPGMQTIEEFMDRRLAPAMRTCTAVAQRIDAVIVRIARAGEMLRTRIEIEAEATNAALLASMDRRSATQLALQRTVEGLSVVAISYYALSLLTYPAKALEKANHNIDATLVVGVATPFIVLFVWLAMRRVRRQGQRD